MSISKDLFALDRISFHQKMWFIRSTFFISFSMKCFGSFYFNSTLKFFQSYFFTRMSVTKIIRISNYQQHWTFCHTSSISKCQLLHRFNEMVYEDFKHKYFRFKSIRCKAWRIFTLIRLPFLTQVFRSRSLRHLNCLYLARMLLHLMQSIKTCSLKFVFF